MCGILSRPGDQAMAGQKTALGCRGRDGRGAPAFNDSRTTKKLTPSRRHRVDRIWTVQQKDGGIRWLKLNQPPMEFDDHYGVTLAALAVGVAPDGYAKTEQAKKGLDGLQRWLKANPAKMLHHKMMLLWAASYLDGFVPPADQKATIKEVLAQQLPNGGWSTVNLGTWKRADGEGRRYPSAPTATAPASAFMSLPPALPPTIPPSPRGSRG